MPPAFAIAVADVVACAAIVTPPVACRSAPWPAKARVSPYACAVGFIVATEMAPALTPSVVALAWSSEVAVIETLPEPTCAGPVAPAFVSAVSSIAASAFAVWPENAKPMSMTSDVAVAWLLLVAPTVSPPPVTAFPAKFAIVAPLTFAVGRFVPPETTPPPAPSELAVAWLTLPAVTLMVDVGWTSAEPPTVAFTFASLVICAIAAEPERATTPMPVKKVSAIVVFAPPAMTVIVDEPVTSPDRSALTPPPIFADATNSPALIVPPLPPCDHAFA